MATAQTLPISEDQKAQIEKLRKAGLKLSDDDAHTLLVACRWKGMMRLRDLIAEDLMVVAAQYRENGIPDKFWKISSYELKRAATETDTAIDVHRRKISPATERRIIHLCKENPDMELQQIANFVGHAYSSVRRILKKNGLDAFGRRRPRNSDEDDDE